MARRAHEVVEQQVMIAGGVVRDNAEERIVPQNCSPSQRLLCFAARLTFALFLAPLSVSAAQSPADAQALQARGDWSGAESIWRQLLQQDAADYRLWASLGIVLVQEGRYQQAADAYRKALSLHPHDAQTELNLGIAYFKAGRLADSLAPLRAAAGRGNTPQTDLLLGMALYGTGKYREAASLLARAADRDAANPELRRTLAESYLYAGDYPNALAQFRRILLEHPDSPGVHVLLGEAYDAMNHPDEAIGEFQLATAGPYLPNAYFGLGYLLWKEHRYDEAASAFQKELDHDSKNSQALAYLGDIALRDRDETKAGDLLRRALELRSDLRLAYFDLGILEADARQFGDAEQKLKRAIALDPKLADAHYRLAAVYQATGRTAEANRERAAVKQLLAERQSELLLKISGKPDAR